VFKYVSDIESNMYSAVHNKCRIASEAICTASLVDRRRGDAITAPSDLSISLTKINLVGTSDGCNTFQQMSPLGKVSTCVYGKKLKMYNVFSSQSATKESVLHSDLILYRPTRTSCQLAL